MANEENENPQPGAAEQPEDQVAGDAAETETPAAAPESSEEDQPATPAAAPEPAEEDQPTTPAAAAGEDVAESPAPVAAAETQEAKPKAPSEPTPPAAAEGGGVSQPGDSPAVPAEEPARKADSGDRRKDIFLELDPAQAETPKIVKAKGSKNIHSGIVFVQATFNNTIVSVTDRQGNLLGWSSAGKMGFRGSRKSTAYAAQLVSQDACRQAMGHGLREAEVRVKGPGSGRESAVRAVQAIGIEITVIRDVTPIPHNGCRPPKARRV